jgi:hypothetical protein
VTPRRTVVLLTSFALGFLPTGICLGQPNRAAAFGWRSSVDTDLAFSELGSDDYTLMATFMLQYPNAYTGPDGGFRRPSRPSSPSSGGGGTWHHVALVRTGDRFRIFLDGTLGGRERTTLKTLLPVNCRSSGNERPACPTSRHSSFLQRTSVGHPSSVLGHSQANEPASQRQFWRLKQGHRGPARNRGRA